MVRHTLALLGIAPVLGGIRSQALSCEYAMGQPPNGETLDINKVNVQFTPKGGTVTTLVFGCKTAGGTPR